MNIYIYGDSITQGLWDAQGGWADRVKAYVQSNELDTGLKTYHEVYNLGVDGNTTQQIIDRFEVETKARIWHGAENAFIFAAGINDTTHRKNGDNDSSPEDYRDQLQQLFDLASNYATRVVFLNSNPVDEQFTNPLPASSTGKCFSNERIELFNDALRGFCQDGSITLIDVASAFTDSGYTKLLADGLHPNTEGHEIIYDILRPTVNK